MKINLVTSQRMLVLLLAAVMLIVSAGCSKEEQKSNNAAGSTVQDGDVTLVIGAYSVVKDAFADLLPAFQKYWLQETGQKVVFQESYEASGTQARAIAGGFEADVAVLAMEGDLDKIAKAGFITHDWKAQSNNGMITNSIVVLGTRTGNPLGIK
ncbi:substrate-binding domain-containing protein, partial [Paenibacillus sp. TAF43_2]